MAEEPPNHDARRQRLRRRQRLEERLAEVALEQYGLRRTSLKLLRQRFVQVFRVASDRGEFTLRLCDLPHPDGGAPDHAGAPGTEAKLRTPEVMRSQLLWLSALGRETDLRVPEPVPTKYGALLGRISTDDLVPRGSLLQRASRRRDAEDLRRDLAGAPAMVRNFMLLRWVPGKNIAGEDLRPEDVSRAGSYVARLHRHAESYEAPRGATFLRWDWEWPFGEAENLWSRGAAYYSPSEMEAFRDAQRRVRRDLEALGYDSEVFGVIHRDITLANLVFDGGRVGAIDFEACGLGHYLLDMSRMHNSLKTHHGDRLNLLWAAFLEGYERERSLPENHHRYLTTFEVMQKVAAVNRRLALLDRGAPENRSPHFLANVASWLKDLSRTWTILPAGLSEKLGELSYFGAELAAVL